MAQTYDQFVEEAILSLSYTLDDARRDRAQPVGERSRLRPGTTARPIVKLGDEDLAVPLGEDAAQGRLPAHLRAWALTVRREREAAIARGEHPSYEDEPMMWWVTRAFQTLKNGTAHPGVFAYLTLKIPPAVLRDAGTEKGSEYEARAFGRTIVVRPRRGPPYDSMRRRALASRWGQS